MDSVVVLTPLAIEHAALVGALVESGGFTETSHTGIKVVSFDKPHGEVNLNVAVGGHGKVQFALSTQLLIQKLSPRLVICAGGAGALNPKLRLHDVTVGEVTIEHDFRLHYIKRPLPRFAADVVSLEHLKRHEFWPDFRVHFGPLASGDEDVIEPKRALEIRESTNAIAVAWEGAGGARACQLQGVGFIEIRAITDTADQDSTSQFFETVKMGMHNVAMVIRQLLPLSGSTVFRRPQY